MNVLVLGGGGREHALVWRLRRSASVKEVHALPGNAGIAAEATCWAGAADDIPRVLQVCREGRINFVIAGPERPLIAGVADAVRDMGVPVYGPSKACAQLEGSKAFAKSVMHAAGVPTGHYRDFTEFEPAVAYISEEWRSGRHVVVKASGEAMGKGVIVPTNEDEAIEAARRALVDGEFGDAGRTIVVEEKFSGRELSVLAICSGTEYRVLPPARDYKKANDGDDGPNTGGMGAFSPVPDVTDAQVAKYAETFIAPILREMERRGTAYVGTLYAGLMLSPFGTMALEYNVRFGDPETQAILPRLAGDFCDLLYRAATGADLPDVTVAEEGAVAVVVAASGYPGDYKKGIPVPQVHADDALLVFHAGTMLSDGQLLSSGGRVLNVVGIGPTLDVARERAYAAIDDRFNSEWHFRKDVALIS